MSLPEFPEDYGVEQSDSSSAIWTTMLVSAGVFMLVGIIGLATILGHRYGEGPFAAEATGGQVIAVSNDGHYVTFTGPSTEKTQLGDQFFVYRAGNEYVGRVEVERHPDAKTSTSVLEELAEKHWGITVNPEYYVGRVILDLTVTDRNSGRPSIQADDKVSSLRPKNLTWSESSR